MSSLKPKKVSKLEKALKAGVESRMPEDQRKELRYRKLEEIFGNLGDKKNRYLFYCPDIPFACTLVKTIYEHVNLLNQLGFSAKVLHEVKGFKPDWLKAEWAKEVSVDYLSERKKSGAYSKPSYSFRPTDTIIVPEGFWTIMTNFVEIKSINKVVMAFGYGGLATAEPGLDWSYLGFTDVICLSERIKEDYSKIWPSLRYYVSSYSIDAKEFEPIPPTEVYPCIALSCRSREDAQTIINIFYNRYSFLDMFQFKVLKKLDTESYADQLKHSSVLVFVDEKAGHPAPPLEALACNVPTIAVFGRGLEHLGNQEGMIFLDTNDNFQITEAIAGFCLNWLQNKTTEIKDKKILEQYTVENVKANLLKTYNELQQNLVTKFAAIKAAVDEGKLSDESLSLDQLSDTQTELSVVE